MGEYDFGYDGDGNGPDLSEPAPAGAEPKWFRDRMDKVSEQMNALTAENDRLKQAQRQNKVADTLKAKGYAPNAAQLYTGEPDGLDDWLNSHGSALAKLPAAGGEEAEPEVPQGPPPSSVPAEGQEAMQRMSEAGTSGAAAPQGSEKELEAAIRAADPAQFEQIMKQHGNRYQW